MSDPFAIPPHRQSMEDQTSRYAPPFSPPSGHSYSMSVNRVPSTHSRPSTASTRASASAASTSRQASGRPSAAQHIASEFGAYLPSEGPSSTAGTRGHSQRASHGATTMPMGIPSQEPTASMSSAHASSHSHSASQQHVPGQQRKRQSHHGLSSQASPPRSEYLSDEYVLHPSVHTFKQAHPNRPMIALGQYILLQTLGEGEFGKVKLGVHSEYGVEVAIKLIRRGQLDEDSQRANKVEREIEVLRQLKHPNIVRMLDVIDTAKYIGIVLEFAGGGELFDYILANRFLKEKDASRLFAQLISGVDYLHQKHIVHRDLKLENLLLDKHRNIIITDFGFANHFERDEDDLMATSCGSPCYAAPELVVSEGLYVGTAVDVWSCGVILYAMLSGYLPYDDDPQNPDGDNINLLYKYIMSTPLNFPDHMSRVAQDILLMMLQPDPTRRCTIPQIEDHPWLDAHRALFDRTIEDHERIFSENMLRKSHMAKRDLAQRRRLQQEAKLAKALARSQAAMGGPGGNMFDQRRTKDHTRHRSALPSTSTMPEYLYNAGGHTSVPPGVAVYESDVLYQQQQQLLQQQQRLDQPIAAAPVPQDMLPTRARTQRTPPKPRPESVNYSDNAMAQEVIMPSAIPEPSRGPVPAASNRHTIQVDYGTDMWSRVQAQFAAGDAAAAESITEDRSPSTSSVPVTPPKQIAAQQIDESQSNDMDVEVSTTEGEDTKMSEPEPEPQQQQQEEEGEEAEKESKIDAPTVPASPAADTPKVAKRQLSDVDMPLASSDVPDAEVPPVVTTLPVVDPDADVPPTSQSAPPALPPSSPSKRSRDAENGDAIMAEDTAPPEFLPSTPRQTSVEPDQIITPRTEVPQRVPSTSKPHAKLPPGAATPDKSPRDLPEAEETLADVTAAPSDATGSITKLPELDGTQSQQNRKRPARSRKGLSLDKFSLAKLLGQGTPSEPPKDSGSPIRTSQRTWSQGHGRSLSVAQPTRNVSESMRDPNPRQRPRTLLLSPEEAAAATDFSGSTTSSPVVGQHGIHPTAHDQRSSTSAVTVDADTARPPSTSTAKRVMDWFRRKSTAKDTLHNIKNTGVADPSSNAGRQSVTLDRTRERVVSMSLPPSKADRALATPTASTRSKPSADRLTSTEAPVKPEVATPSPSIVIVESPSSPEPAAASSPVKDDVPKPDARIPLAPANSMANVDDKIMLNPNRVVPTRSKSQHVPSSLSKDVANGSPALISARKAAEKRGLNASTAVSVDETKLRVHTGLVDQSALSSQTPAEIMEEVLRVLHGMGIEVKQEADFRLRCTRVRRRKAGATTGLSSGAFSLVSAAAANRSEGRGVPSTSSGGGGGLGGLKGMLLRRGSSYSSQHSSVLARSESDLLNSVSNSGMQSPSLGPLPEPLYGEHAIDNGDEVRFAVELCRIKNLHGLYLLSIKRLRGSVWSFKFIYQTVVERCETLTH